MSVDLARFLRHNQTEAEARLWQILRARQLAGYRFRRQHPVGKYVADFACTKHKLIVEADGGQHADSSHDAQRDAWLAEQGWRVLRFWNNDILSNGGGVARQILSALNDAAGVRPAATDPSPDLP
jgi:very-short-patch-repair endonuclease